MRGGDHIVSFPGICKMTEKMLNYSCSNNFLHNSTFGEDISNFSLELSTVIEILGGPFTSHSFLV